MPEPQLLPSFHAIIAGQDETCVKPVMQITNGVSAIVDKVQLLLVYWEKKYKSTWDQDKEAYIRYPSLRFTIYAR